MKKLIFTFLSLIAIGTSFGQQHVVFANSPDNASYSQTWANGNIVVTTGAFLPVTTTFFHSASNALVFEYGSGPWSAMVKKPRDITGATNVEFWIYSETAVNSWVLPACLLQRNNDAKSSTVAIGNISGNLEASTWKKVTIPISSFSANADFLTNFKSVSFTQQDHGANVGEKLIIDDIVINIISTGISQPVKDNIKVSYSKGIISIPEYNGEAYLYDISGKNIGKVDVVKGNANVELTKGLYIIKIVNGSAKIIVD